MDTKIHLDESADAQSADAQSADAQSADSRKLAYGNEVCKLLSSSTSQRWTAELWTMFGGYILALKELGHAPDLSNTFWSFKELVEFFETVEAIRAGQGDA